MKIKKPGRTVASVYLDPSEPGSLTGSTALLHNQFLVGRKKRVQSELENIDAYTTHRLRKIRFKRNPIVVLTLQERFQTDLIDMKKPSNANLGINWIMITMDVFSKRMSCQLLRQKSG